MLYSPRVVCASPTLTSGPTQPGNDMKKQILAAAILILTGCGSAPTWRHPTKSAQEFYQDNSRCMAMAGAGQANQIVDSKNPIIAGYNQGLAAGTQSNQKLIRE